MTRKILTKEEMLDTKGYEAITLTTVLACLAIALLISITYRFFVSKKGNATLPGGFKFSWGA